MPSEANRPRSREIDMKKSNQAADDTSKLSWLRKVKVAVAAFAFVAAGVFGASAVAEVPAPEADETAQLSFAKAEVSVKDVRGGGWVSYSRSGSWS